MQHLKHEALELVHSQRTMVLATSADGHDPWAAPVYYVYHKSGFYFFSSPLSRHIKDCQNRETAAVIFSDSDCWEQIQGLQMKGRTQLISKVTHRIKIAARFILKFPFAEPFLRSKSPSQKNSTHPPSPTKSIVDRVELFAFFPTQIFYVNNLFGFGKRIAIQLEDAN
jgi:hypothetical protein